MLFLLGPSGSGKTTLADAMIESLNILHICFDRDDGKNGVDEERLRNEWNTFLDDKCPLPLAKKVQCRINSGLHKGAIITCPSGIMPIEYHMEGSSCYLSRAFLIRMAGCGIRHVVLYGPKVACMHAAMNRNDGRVDNEASWCESNHFWYDRFLPEQFSDSILETFCSGNRRDIFDLIQEFSRRFIA